MINGTKTTISYLMGKLGLKMIDLNVEVGPKSLRETLCLAQSFTSFNSNNPSQNQQHIKNLQLLINECDRHRPLGINGKHGNLHTETCGCLDKGSESTWGSLRAISEQPTWTERKQNTPPAEYKLGDISMLIILKGSVKSELLQLRSALDVIQDRIADLEEKTNEVDT